MLYPLTGYFMYIDPDTNSGHAMFQSPVYSANPGYYKCFSFWYYMNGINTGTLTVTKSVIGEQVPLWSLTGDQPTGDWLFGQIPVDQETDFAVGF